MPDVRLIDANAVVTIQVFDEMTEEYSMETITVAKAIDRWSDEGCPPTIDAVPVVRCRECKKRGHDWECPLCWMEWHEDKTRPGAGRFEKKDETEDDGFCHMGAKMDGGAE